MKIIKRNIIMLLSVLLTILLIIIGINITKAKLIAKDNVQLKAEEIVTRTEYEIVQIDNTQLGVAVTIENQNGIEEISVGDLIINCNGKSKIGFDKTMLDGDEKKVRIKLTTGEIEEYQLVPSLGPTLSISNMDPFNDGSAKTINIDYPDNPNLICYYSTDEGQTWEVYNEPVNVRLAGTTNVIAKLEYSGKKMIPRNRSNSSLKLLLEWNKLNEIAKAISDSYGEITSESQSATVYVDGALYTLNVGEIYELKYNGEVKKVRIIGFNHDDLTNTAAYGGENQKAGITFEFVDILIHGVWINYENFAKLQGGWSTSRIRSLINGSAEKNKLSNIEYIKQVKKEYIPTYNVASKSTCDDYLWLLSSGEIWNEAVNAKIKEGTQYAWYKNIVSGISSKNPNSNLLKRYGNTVKAWFLRSSASHTYVYWSRITNEGIGGSISVTNSDTGTVPCFCI